MLLDFTGSPHGGVHKLLPEWNTQPEIIPVGLVKHTIVGSAAGAFYYFRDSTGTESTLILPKTGVIWQCMSLVRSADAQVAGNGWTVGGKRYGYLSIETEDNGDPEHDPWTREQVESLVWLDDKLARVFAWPRQQTTAPSGITVSGGGSGYHSMWGINTATAHPNPWTTANGKTCPAAPRIGQYRATLLPAYISGTTPEEDIVDATTIAAIATASAEATARRLGVVGTQVGHIDDMLSRNLGRLLAVADQVSAGETHDDQRTAAILGAIAALPTGGLSDEQAEQQAVKIATILREQGVPVDTDAVVHALGVALLDEPAA